MTVPKLTREEYDRIGSVLVDVPVGLTKAEEKEFLDKIAKKIMWILLNNTEDDCITDDKLDDTVS
jgi:hypothetical protein